jgi:hypothetical protein
MSQNCGNFKVENVWEILLVLHMLFTMFNVLSSHVAYYVLDIYNMKE